MPRLLLLVLTVAVALGCVASPGESGPSPTDRDVNRDAGSTSIRPEPEPTSFWDQSGQLLEVTVGPARRECYGPFRRMCLIVDGGYFYDEIEGFEHEPGYEYRLRILRYDPYMGQERPRTPASTRIVCWKSCPKQACQAKSRMSRSVRHASPAPKPT